MLTYVLCQFPLKNGVGKNRCFSRQNGRWCLHCIIYQTFLLELFSFLTSKIYLICRGINSYLVVVVGAIGYRLNMVGPIEKIPMQANLYSPTGSSIKISGWSGVRFSVRFPVFVLLMVISKKNLCRKISFVILVLLLI